MEIYKTNVANFLNLLTRVNKVEILKLVGADCSDPSRASFEKGSTLGKHQAASLV